MNLQSEAQRYWRMGQYDTADIAEKLGCREADVYRAVFFPTAEAAESTVNIKPLQCPPPEKTTPRRATFAGFDKTERQIG